MLFCPAEQVYNAPVRYLRSILLLLPALLLVTGCGESEKERREHAARFTTSTKPAPNPQKEKLEDLVREDKSPVPTSLGGAARFEPYSLYDGADIRQVTGVSGRSLLLCFTAPWCNHSNNMRKSLQTLVKTEQGRVQVVEVNADAYPLLAQEFGITKVPTTYFYTEGVKLRSVEGAYTAESLSKFLRSLLSRREQQ